MKITILTLFPEMFDGFLNNSIIKRAISKGTVSFNIVNIRDYTLDKNNRVDTPPVGGGAGLIMKCQPIVDALRKTTNPNSYKLLTSPKGTRFNQTKAKELAKLDDITIICGHYEGIDERVNNYVDELISVGDYVLTGGELPSMIIADSVTRLLDGSITKESLDEESFDTNLLEYPQYTEPYDFEGYKVPDILYSGNHEAIRKYRRKKSLEETLKYRKDLLDVDNLSKEDKKLYNSILEDKVDDFEIKAIEKGKKFIHKD